MSYKFTLSTFHDLVKGEFGQSYGDALLSDFILRECGDKTPSEALQAGYDPATVWEKMCDELEVPEKRRWGADTTLKKEEKSVQQHSLVDSFEVDAY